MKPWQKPSTKLAFAAWASVFALGWLLALRRLPLDALSGRLFAFFVLLAVVTSAIASPGKDEG